MEGPKKIQIRAKKQLAPIFIEKGKILSKEEYNALGKNQPIAGSKIKKIFGNYAKLVVMIEKDEPLMALIAQSAAIQAEKAKPKPAPKPMPKAKPAPKVGASSVEK